MLKSPLIFSSCIVYHDQYNRIYSPITFGKKYDPNGDYIRHFLPVLKGTFKFPQFHHVLSSSKLSIDKVLELKMECLIADMPKQYIYEPWTAPISIQTKANCIIGKDYPMPGELSHVCLIGFQLWIMHNMWYFILSY